jgi:hypothetical protein
VTALDQQLMIVDESTYGTIATPIKTFEFNSEGIEEMEGRTEGDPLRVGTFFKRDDRWTPFFDYAAGPIQLDVLTKGFGYWLKHMLGAVATTGPVETTVYTHTGTVADLFGKSFTAQFNRPFYPSGTAQQFAYLGGKITKWGISNSVNGNLVLDLNTFFNGVDTATALASASYPASMEPLTWAGGILSIAGSNYDITDFACSVDNGLDIERGFIRANTARKEPGSGGRRSGEFSLSSDFDSMTQRNRAHTVTRAGALAQIIATWNGPTLLGSTLFPQLKITIPAVRFDKWKGAADGPTGIKQELSGVIHFPTAGTSPVTIAYASADVTP